MADRFFRVGDVIYGKFIAGTPMRMRPEPSEPWAVLEARSVTARAHNDLWEDRTYVLGKLSSDLQEILFREAVSTHDVFRQDVEADPDVKITVKKVVTYEITPFPMPGRHRKPA